VWILYWKIGVTSRYLQGDFDRVYAQKVRKNDRLFNPVLMYSLFHCQKHCNEGSDQFGGSYEAKCTRQINLDRETATLAKLQRLVIMGTPSSTPIDTRTASVDLGGAFVNRMLINILQRFTTHSKNGGVLKKSKLVHFCIVYDAVTSQSRRLFVCFGN
jgi:hypothetical protein